jgi:hypothetical protein
LDLTDRYQIESPPSNRKKINHAAINNHNSPATLNNFPSNYSSHEDLGETSLGRVKSDQSINRNGSKGSIGNIRAGLDESQPPFLNSHGDLRQEKRGEDAAPTKLTHLRSNPQINQSIDVEKLRDMNLVKGIEFTDISIETPRDTKTPHLKSEMYSAQYPASLMRAGDHLIHQTTTAPLQRHSEKNTTPVSSTSTLYSDSDLNRVYGDGGKSKDHGEEIVLKSTVWHRVWSAGLDFVLRFVDIILHIAYVSRFCKECVALNSPFNVGVVGAELTYRMMLLSLFCGILLYSWDIKGLWDVYGRCSSFRQGLSHFEGIRRKKLVASGINSMKARAWVGVIARDLLTLISYLMVLHGNDLGKTAVGMQLGISSYFVARDASYLIVAQITHCCCARHLSPGFHKSNMFTTSRFVVAIPFFLFCVSLPVILNADPDMVKNVYLTQPQVMNVNLHVVCLKNYKLDGTPDAILCNPSYCQSDNKKVSNVRGWSFLSNSFETLRDVQVCESRRISFSALGENPSTIQFNLPMDKTTFYFADVPCLAPVDYKDKRVSIASWASSLTTSKKTISPYREKLAKVDRLDPTSNVTMYSSIYGTGVFANRYYRNDVISSSVSCRRRWILPLREEKNGNLTSFVAILDIGQRESSEGPLSCAFNGNGYD